MLFVVCLFFLNHFFGKNSFRLSIRVSNWLDPDQDRQNIGPDLDPNCLQKYSADDTSRQRVNGNLASTMTLITVFVLVASADNC